MFLSSDAYDAEKDLTFKIDDISRSVEVKTQTPIFKFDAFTLAPNQWEKADSVDHLYFLNVPRNELEFVSIWEATPKSFFLEHNFGPEKRTFRMYKRSRMDIIKTFRNTEITKSLYNLSMSTFKEE